MKIKSLLFFSLFFLLIKAQTYQYDIVLFDDVIGVGTAEKKVNSDGSYNLELQTKAKAKVMFKERSSANEVSILLKNNQLIECKYQKESNGEVQDVKITFENGKYYHTDNGVTKVVEKPIKYTTTHFFFEEPVNVTEVYVERMNEFVPIVKEGNVYKTEVDGGSNYYTYENGVLVEFRMKNVINVYMNKV